MSTSSNLPLCVYCGTARPADRSECPRCGRPWIDVRVGALAESKIPAAVGAAVTAETPNVSAVAMAESDGGQPDPDPDPEQLTIDLAETDTSQEPSSFRRPIAVVLGVSAAAVLAMFAFGLLDGNGEPAQQATVAPVAVPTTTAQTTTLPPSTTTLPPSTTTAPTTTIPAPSLIGVWGDPVPISRLTLKAGGIGPIAIGTPSAEALGRLVASLGTPDEVSAAGPEHGLCPGDEGRIVRWSELTAIVLGTVADGTFSGYRFQEPEIPTSKIDLATPSGIRLGDDLATLNQVYAKYTLTYETVGGESTFGLFEDGELLLWGPISSTEESGRVVGIYSPPPCSTG